MNSCYYPVELVFRHYHEPAALHLIRCNSYLTHYQCKVSFLKEAAVAVKEFGQTILLRLTQWGALEMVLFASFYLVIEILIT